MTTIVEVVQAAKPGASLDYAQFILFERTPFPIGKVSARMLYKAASRHARAFTQGIRLCDFCDNRTLPDHWTCEHCNHRLASVNQAQAH